MKRAGLFLLAVIGLLLMPGCYDQINLEDTSLTIMMGLDSDAENNLVVYSQSPVFYKEAKEKTEIASVKVATIREARAKLDAILTGLTTGEKNQTVLIGKRLLAQKDWHRVMDLFYRDPKQSATPRVIIVDGPLEDIFQFKPKDKPRLSLHMRKLIDTANKRNITVLTNLQELRRQMKDKGTTPSITEIKKEADKINITGTGLLNKQGEYATNLSLQESGLLLILQDRVKGEESLSIPVEETSNGKAANRRRVTFIARNIKTKVKTTYSENTFRFDVHIAMAVEMGSLERDDSDEKENKAQLEAEIAKELKKEFETMIKKCQQHQVDPFGFGLYARAYQYPAWKSVQDQWGKSFAKATVHITPEVHIKTFGVIE